MYNQYKFKDLVIMGIGWPLILCIYLFVYNLTYLFTYLFPALTRRGGGGGC